MTDLSLPPLTLLPQDELPAGEAGRASAGTWPAPPGRRFPRNVPLQEGEPCEVEGLNGRVLSAQLIGFDPAQDVIRLLAPPSRLPVSLKRLQYRKITLLNPVSPLPAAPDSTPPPADPAEPFLLSLVGQADYGGHTHGHVDTPYGCFLYPPHGDGGSVRRVFVPDSAVVTRHLGPNLGVSLVAGPPPAAPNRASAAATAELRPTEPSAAQVVFTAEQLQAALEQQAQMPMMRVGEALISMGYISAAQLQAALTLQKSDRSLPLGELLVRAGHISPSDLRAALARKMGYPVVDLDRFPVDRDLLSRVPQNVARRLRMLPLMNEGGRVVVAVEDPSRGDSLDEIEFLTQSKAVPVLAADDSWPDSIDRTYARYGLDTSGAYLPDAPPLPELPGTDQLLAALELNGPSGGEDDTEDGAIEQSDNSLVRLINAMIIDAHSQGASDIHIECTPGKGKVRIRFRRDGGLKPYMELPHTHRGALIARLKIMCDLDISEKRRPQDGKINFARFVAGLPLELRVATIPTANGLEDAVLRLLASAKPIPLEQLGLSPHNQEALRQAVQRPYGMVLCVGPTGSGKTTTLHSALSHINTPDRKIWTAEDPVEITQHGLRQVQVNPKIDWTFARALRAFLRADPDVIMVGEIRDTETAQIAVEASLTGHLVLSTLHTNSAPETVTRLLDMGLDPFSFADSLLAVLAQRLAKRLCAKCRTSTPATEAEVEAWLDEYLHPFADMPEPPTREAVRADWLSRFAEGGTLRRWHAPGCSHCDQTGYRGRAGLHELLIVDRELRRLIQTGARTEQLQASAMAHGMRTLRQDGLEKVLAGITSIEEVRATSNH